MLGSRKNQRGKEQKSKNNQLHSKVYLVAKKGLGVIRSEDSKTGLGREKPGYVRLVEWAVDKPASSIRP